MKLGFPPWAVISLTLCATVVLLASLVGGLELTSVWQRFVQLNVAMLALAFFLIAVRVMNAISGNKFDVVFESATKSSLGLLGILIYYGCRIIALGAFLGQVWRW